MTTKRRIPTFQERTLSALETAHFSSVISGMESECLTYCPDEAEEELHWFIGLFEDDSCNRWVN